VSGFILSGVLFFLVVVPHVSAVSENVTVEAVVPASGPVCGNGIEEAGEECDDSNTDNGDGCSSTCQDEGGNGCPGCTNPTPVCGNNALESGEQCDDGGTINGDGCSATCQTEPPGGSVCGNNILESLEQCDDGNTIGGDGCSSVCSIEGAGPACGNNVLESGEQCDDGNVSGGDGCSETCLVEVVGPTCGNSILESGEQCDDGNTTNSDGCSSVCQNEPPQGATCGNGILEGLEQCDDGNTSNNDGCSSVCRREGVGPTCGNNVLESGEQCDDGNTTNSDGCSSVCQNEPPQGATCGNGILEGLEQCDDGNTTSEDGCSSSCSIEGPIIPGGPVCGDGLLEGAEQCDDGNTVSGDGCSYICIIENVFGPICGNGVLEIGEECDDGNTDGDDGCSRSCREEKVPGEEINTIIGIIGGNDPPGTKIPLVTRIVVDNAERLAQRLAVLVDDPDVEQLTERAVAPAILAFVVVSLLPSLWGILLPLLRFLFLQPIFIFGKKRKEWGIVYNSLDKKPIDLAMVRLIEESSGRVIRSRVTDKEGRFLFIVDTGRYLIEVVKQGFVFPSNILHGKQDDGQYRDLYFGEQIAVTEDKVDITPNIPLDLEGEHKTPKRIRWSRRWNTLQHLLSLIGIIASVVFLYIKPSIITAALLVIHIVMYVIFFRFVKLKKPKSWGIVRSKEAGKPLKHAVARLFSKEYDKLVATEVTDRKGRYSFLAGNSDYYVTFEKKGFEKETKEVSIRESVGIVKEHVSLEKDDESPVGEDGVGSSVDGLGNKQEAKVSGINKSAGGSASVENSNGGIVIVEDE